MPYKSGYKDVYYIGDDYIKQTSGLETKTGKPVVYSEIIQNHNKSNKFVDIDFPTDDSSVDAEKLTFDSARGSYSKYQHWDKTVLWKRPQEALELHNKTNHDLLSGTQVKYVFSQASVKDGSTKSRFDITQGRIGDCWMVASLSQVTQKQEVIDFVVPDDNLNNNDSGAYHFRYYHFGAWVDVVVDDYIPLFEENGPGKGYTIMICKPPLENDVYEMWPLLAEKAYAKIQGTIQQIDGSAPLFALEDLTGGIGEIITINKDNFANGAKLFEKLKRLSRVSFIGLGTADYEGKRKGIAGGHAYCVTALTTVTYQGQPLELIRVRNPWGEGEWEGPWNDKSTEFNALSEEDRKKVGLVIEDDGEFWISAQDATDYFDTVDVCYWFPEALLPIISKTFDIQNYHGEFTTLTTEYVELWNNPQYVIEVKGAGEEDCAIMANVTLKCKLQDRNWSTSVYCYRILDPGAWPGNKFPREFFRPSNSTKCEEPTSTLGKSQGVQQRATAGYSVPPGKYVIALTLSKIGNAPDEYVKDSHPRGFVLRLSGQIVPTGELNSMAMQVQLADDVHTDTGVAKKAPGNGMKELEKVLAEFAAKGINVAGIDKSKMSDKQAFAVAEQLRSTALPVIPPGAQISINVTPQFMFQQ